MKWNVGMKIGVAFALALAVFVLVSVVSYMSTTQLIAASDSRKHTYDVLDKLSGLLSLTLDVETGQRGYALTGEDRFLEPYRAALGRIDDHLLEIRKLTSDNPRQLERVAALQSIIKERLAFTDTNIMLRRTQGLQAAAEHTRQGRGKVLMDSIRRIDGAIRAEEMESLTQRSMAADRNAVRARQVIKWGTAIAILLAALTGFAITRDIAGPLRDLTVVAERITIGDLSQEVASNGRADEVGALARSFAGMTNSLRGMATSAEQIAAGDLRAIHTPQSRHDVLGNAFVLMSTTLREQTRQLVDGANVLGASASEILASTSQLAASAAQSAAAVRETTVTVEQVRQTAHVASQKARYVSDSAQKAAQISQSGRKSTEEAGAGMRRIRLQMDGIGASMGRLSDQSQAIGQIIATVEDLAAQSNLLAVNAAIEATKAGEHGKGFGVVAQEVKSLAQQSRQATSSVRQILGDIQKATTTAVLAAEQGAKAVEEGTRQTEIAGESIAALSGSVLDAAQAATQIVASSQEQLVGVDQVAGAMESINQASTQNVASATQLETAARNLSDLGRRLQVIVARYQV